MAAYAVPTNLEIARRRVLHGRIDLAEFERQVEVLLAEGRADDLIRPPIGKQENR